MKTVSLIRDHSFYLGMGLAAIVLAGCASHPPSTVLNAPPGTVPGAVRADLAVNSFKCPSATSSNNCPTMMGSVTTSGIQATQVDIRQGGQSGRVIANLNKTGPDVWTVPSGVTLTDSQYADYYAGNLYVGVHDANGPRVFSTPIKP